MTEHRALWLVCRRALVMVIRAFDQHYGIKENGGSLKDI
jgi:hypothetical protein